MVAPVQDDVRQALPGSVDDARAGYRLRSVWDWLEQQDRLAVGGFRLLRPAVVDDGAQVRAAPNWEAQPRAAAILVRASAAAATDAKLPEAVRRERAGAYRARADELLSAWVKRRPGNASEHNNLAWRLATSPDARFRDPAQALRLANWAVERAPGQATYWKTLGVAEYRMGHWKAAVAAMKKSMELSKKGNSFDWFFLAMAHWQLGEKDTAREWYVRAAEWMDNNEPINEELLRFRAEAEGLLGIAKKKD